MLNPLLNSNCCKDMLNQLCNSKTILILPV